MLLALLIFAAVILTYGMFTSQQMMLGFPCTIFWAIAGGQAYQLHYATWDIYYLTFFASFGMAIFCAFAAYALRTKKEEAQEGDLYFDEGGDKDIKFIDESSKGEAETEPDEDKPRRVSRSIRERAERRRAKWD